MVSAICKGGVSLIEPFDLGWKCVGAAWNGKKVDVINPAGAMKDMGECEQIMHLAIGLLLLVPIVNMVALAILRCCNAEIVVPSKIIEAGHYTDDIAKNARSLMEYEGYSRPKENPVSDQEYQARKASASRKVLEGKPIQRGQCNPFTHKFDLDAALKKYKEDTDPIRLVELCDLVEAPQEIKHNLKIRLAQYSNIALPRDPKTPPSTSQSAKMHLSKLYHFFFEQLSKVDAKSQSHMNSLIINIFRGVIDAHANCMDQTNAQLEQFMIELVARFTIAQGSALTPKERLIGMAAHQLFEHRANLIKLICMQEFSQDEHMADIERLIKKRLSEDAGLKSQLADVGAIMTADSDTLEMLATHVLEIFQTGQSGKFFAPEKSNEKYTKDSDKYIRDLQELRLTRKYEPEKFLLDNLRCDNPVTNFLRGELMEWAKDYFQYEADDPETESFVKAISENPDWPATEGGPLTPKAIAYLLKEVGILV